MNRLMNKAMLATAAVGLILSAGSANAASFTLNDNDARVDIETDRSSGLAGVVNWIIDQNVPGAVDVMFEEAFWYRTALDNRELALASEPITFQGAFDTNANPGNDVLNVTYQRAGVFQADVRYSLQGGQGCCSDLAEQVTITNLATFALPFSLFEYTDFDIGNIPDGIARYDGSNVFIQLDGNFITQTSVLPSPDAWEINFYPNTVIKLDDNVADNLSNNTSPLLFGDLTWAAQWDFLIPVGGSVTISKDKLTSAVPAPAGAALLGLGLVALGLIRRRAA